ncbi:MAG: hypothetical protein NZ742_11345 [Acidobacteria bacterium]|nr:hypothetical protein [Acidobacteriota bacterium]MDW7984706.1 hypothetical protein [Acidobacteriota bacterium]
MAERPYCVAGIDPHKDFIAVAVLAPDRVIRVGVIRCEPFVYLRRRLERILTDVCYVAIEWPYLGKSPHSYATVLETAATVRTLVRLRGIPSVRVRGSQWMRLLKARHRTRAYLKQAARRLARQVTRRSLTSDQSDAVCIGLWLLDRLVVHGRLDPPVPLLERTNLGTQ